ncbi:hypothetical protein [Rhizobium acaciae]|uniref:hypothetical protein n=1 Tax=Rhizobium acaciae TaxID=2989736 RepID=UPI00222103CF|nr:hypothetical protein [Rhizobium acaciae]MCW1754956.1 hypothetical protein [Rhizobium acaciae]
MALGQEEAGAIMIRGVAGRTGLLIRGILTGSVAIIASHLPTQAEERLFERTSAWEVALVTPDSAGTDKPYCDVRTTSWAAKRVSVHLTLTDVDQLQMSFLLYKDGWGLPVGESTAVSVMRLSTQAPFPMTFKVTDPDTLYSEPAADGTDAFPALMIAATWQTKKPDSLVLQFEGNEDPWVIPAITLFETYQLGRSLGECQNELVAMGPKLFGGDLSAQNSATSPFNRKAPSAPPPKAAEPSASDNKIVANDWVFSTEDEGEDGRKICYASTKAGDIKVGFMGSPGKDLIGYVDGLFDGDTIATWRVDDVASQSLIGAPSDYSGWTEFTVPKELLDEVAHGHELAITGSSGKQVVVSLKGAAEAIPAFNACFGKGPTASR